jgi:hypothetical protein
MAVPFQPAPFKAVGLFAGGTIPARELLNLARCWTQNCEAIGGSSLACPLQRKGQGMHNISPKSFRATWVALLALALFFCPLALAAQSLALVWNPSPSPGVAGYIVYYGTDGTDFASQMDVGTNTSATVTGLQPGTTNQFEVVAYDVNRMESPPSNLIEYSVPATTQTITVQTNANTDFTLLVSGDGTFAQKLKNKVFKEGKQYTLTATAAKGSLFAGWVSNGMVVATTPKYTFRLGSNVVLQANFIPNPFIPVVGTYRGLFYVANDAAVESSGSFVASVTSSGAFSAKLRLGAVGHSYAGKFSLTGVALKSIPRQGLSPITVQLQLDLSNGPMTGTISDGTWTADLVANPDIYSKTNPAPQAGKYTLLIPGSDNASAQPGGNGFGAVTVDTSGHVSLSGTLGDGTPVTSSSVVASQGQWPFYVSLYGGKGSLLGWLSFTNDDGISGPIDWFKLPQATAKLYPGGFTNGTEAIGSIYQYTNGLPVLGFTNGLLSLLNGDLAQSITNDVALGPDLPATDRSAIKLTVKTSSGLFHGSVINPETQKPISVKGIVLQNQNCGAGFFLGTNQSGSVLLSAAP